MDRVQRGPLAAVSRRFEEVPLRRPATRAVTAESYGIVGSILADRQGRVWLASTAHGLGRIDDPRAAVPAIRWYGKADGLSSDTAWMLVEDLSGDLFVGTGRGVDRFDPGHGALHALLGRRWACPAEKSGEAFAIDRDESGWRQRTAWRDSTHGPMTGVLSRSRSLPPSASAACPCPSRADGAHRFDGFTVQPGDRRLEIDFVSPGAQTADGLRYQHQLEGVDRDWTITDARTVALAGAAAGDVPVSRARGLRRRHRDRSRRRSSSPCWRRCGSADGSSRSRPSASVPWHSSFHRSRVRRAIAVERVRSQIAADLHDGVGASLSRIAILSEVVRQQAHAALPDAMPALAAIGDNARAVIDDMSDAVWFIDPRLDNLQQVVTRARAMASELFDGQRIRWTVEAPDDASGVPLASEQRRHVYLILKEALTNVLRHAHATNVVVRVTASRGRLRIEVTDDGVGLDGKASNSAPGPRGGHGLENMRRRAAALGGTARIVSPPQGRGTQHRRGRAGDAPACSCGWPHRIAALTCRP